MSEKAEKKSKKKFFLAIMVSKEFKDAIASAAIEHRMTISKYIKTSLLSSLLESKKMNRNVPELAES